MARNLSTLPTEIIEMISADLGPDQRHFRLVCKEIHQKAYRSWIQIFESLVTDLSRSSFHEFFEHFQYLKYCRSLTIKGDEYAEGDMKRRLGHGLKWRRNGHDILDEKNAGYNLLYKLLVDCLPNCNSVCLFPGYEANLHSDIEFARTSPPTGADVLSMVYFIAATAEKKINRLHLPPPDSYRSTSCCMIPEVVIFDTVYSKSFWGNMTELSVDLYVLQGCEEEDMLWILQTATNLTSLTVTNFYDDGYLAISWLQALCNHNAPSRLRSLSLGSVAVDYAVLDGLIKAQKQTLTSLKLSGISIYPPSWAQFFNTASQILQKLTFVDVGMLNQGAFMFPGLCNPLVAMDGPPPSPPNDFPFDEDDPWRLEYDLTFYEAVRALPLKTSATIDKEFMEPQDVLIYDVSYEGPEMAKALHCISQAVYKCR
ncbi:hypothetical protein BT63DRAFT_410896 [Microthyrium microscopicum]|uniref:F-box domain-containing protein n=1 Tax=Microthyrium microscopicum TaxID=703497 RepID=A0A6A6URC0_9PEZI|nr:hypothetical protein BT63DRAFT_410896 [Microthyrium microscopicum]